MSEPWLDDPLGALIGADRVVNFFERVYEREALVVSHDAPDRFAGLLSIDAVDRLVTSTDLREGQLELADAARPVGKSEYVDAAGFIDRGAVAARHRAGATIILQQAHQIEPPLGRFCRALEYVFSAHVQTNLYLTPPNAQGFSTHFDNHCVLVVQIAGEKAWRLYDKPVDTPYRGERFRSGEHAAGTLRQEFVLKAGDCAYVPRGMMHDAMTSGDAPSLHITIGLITRTWADLMLEAVSEAALRMPEFRRSLPAGCARADFDRVAARAHLKALAVKAAEEIALDPALDVMADSFIRSRSADNRGAIAEAPRPIADNDRFRAARHVPHRLAEDGERLALIAPGGELAFFPQARPALERALAGPSFTPAELGVEHADKIVARLFAYGLVVRA